MLKNKYNDYQNIVYQIHQNFLENNKSLTLVTRNAKESEYLFYNIRYNKLLKVPELKINYLGNKFQQKKNITFY